LLAKVRLSERKAKGKFIFLFFSERKYLRHWSKVRLSERKAKGKFIFLFFSDSWLNALRLSKTNKNKEKPTKTGSLTKQIKTCFSLSLLVFIGF